MPEPIENNDIDTNDENAAGLIQISTSAPKAVKKGSKPEGWALELPFNVGETLQEAVALYGEEAIFSLYSTQVRVAFQAQVRKQAEAGREDSEIISAMADWKPGQTIAIAKDPMTSILQNFSSLSREEQANILLALQQANPA